MELHELHRRRLEATIQLLEDAFDRIERALTAAGAQGRAGSQQNPLSDADTQKLLAGIAELRVELRSFSGDFKLQKHPKNLRQMLNAEISSAWVFLENCRPKRMKGYGVPFSPELRAHLEGRVEKLLERVLALQKYVR